MPAELVLDDIMPEQSKKKVRFANLSTSFVQVAKIGSESDQAEAIARRHIKEMKAEFAQLNKIWRKKNKTAATHPIGTNTGHEETSAPNVTEQQAAPTVPQQPVAPQQTSRSVPQQSAPRSVPQQQRTTPTIPHPALAHHTPQRRQTRNATSAPTKRRAVSTATSSGGPLPTATAGKYADNSSARWVNLQLPYRHQHSLLCMHLNNHLVQKLQQHKLLAMFVSKQPVQQGTLQDPEHHQFKKQMVFTTQCKKNLLF
jgi:hypothetical protein